MTMTRDHLPEPTTRDGRPRRLWTFARVQQLREYLRIGHTYEEAAIHFGTTKSAIAGAVHRYFN